MKKLLLIIGIFLPIVANAQWVGIDKKTIEQVSKNTASALAKEEIINNNIKKQEEHEKRSKDLIGVVNLSKNLYLMSMKNVDKFDKDNENIVEIARLAKMIAFELVATSKELMKNPKTTISSWSRIQSLTSETVGSLQYIYSLVSNGKVTLRIPGLPTISKYKDGENLLDPLTRLDICDRTIVNLRRIYNILVQIKYQAMYTTTWAQIFNENLPLESFFIIDSKDIVNGIIKDFKKIR